MSSKQLFSNNARSTVAIQVSANDTQITVADGSQFTNPAGAGGYSLVTLENSGVLEIVKISNVSGNVLTVFGGLSGRGQEGTSAAVFPIGTLIEERITADTLDSFITDDIYLPKLASVSLLSDPASMDSIAYMAGSDDGGALVLSYASSTTLWNFPSYRLIQSGTCVSGTTLLSNIGVTLPSYAAGKYIIQFTDGPNQGYPRAITGVSGNTVSWGTALPGSVGTSAFEVYQSNYSAIEEAGGGGGGGGTGVSYRGTLSTGNRIAYTTTTTPSFVIGDLIDGLEIKVNAPDPNANTSPTLSPNGLTARSIKAFNGSNLRAGDLSGEVILRYSSGLTAWVLIQSGWKIGYRATLSTSNGSAYTATTSPLFTADEVVDGLEVKVKGDSQSNSSVTPTINFNSIGAVRIYSSTGGDVPLGDVAEEFTLRYSSSSAGWRRLGPGPSTISNTVSLSSVQSQTGVAYTTGGSNTAYTITPSPAITANAEFLRFRVEFHTAAGSNPTLNVSSQGALALKYRDESNAFVNVTSAQIPNLWVGDVECQLDGATPYWVLVDRADLGEVVIDTTKPALTSGASITLTSFPAYQAYRLTLAHNATLAYPVPGTFPESGTLYIDVTVNATGGWIMSFASGYNLVPNGSVWQSTANSVNRIWLVIRTTSIIDVYIENIV
jgi:hypothetical protein